MNYLSPSLALAGTIVLAYWNSFGGVFQFDDFNVIVGNPVIHSWQAWLSDVPAGIRPFLKFTYMLNWEFGVGVFGFHLVNTIIQVINTILVYHLSLRILENNHLESMKAAAFTSALFFALHPIQTEAVTYICGRSTSLMAMFYLGSLLAYIHGCNHHKSWALYLVSPLLFMMAVLTKETALTLPVAVLLLDRLRKSKWEWTVPLRNLIIHWGLLAIMIIALSAHNGYLKLLETSFQIRGWKENLLSQIGGIYYLMSKFFLITSLNIDPDLPIVSECSLSVIGEAAFLSILISLGLFCLKRRPSLGFGLIWFFIHLMPAHSFIPRMDITNERQLYLASWGIFLALSIEVEKLRKWVMRGKVLIHLGIILLSFILGFFTLTRNNVYRSEIALWEDTVGRSPHKARVYNNLGYAYYLSGRYDDAINAYQRALQLRPGYFIARNNLTRLENLLLAKE